MPSVFLFYIKLSQVVCVLLTLKDKAKVVYIIISFEDSWLVTGWVNVQEYVLHAIVFIFFTSLDAIFKQSTPRIPVVFILSAGSDPATDLMKMADHCAFGGRKFCHLSLGQGQGPVSLVLLCLRWDKGYFS